MKRRVNQVWLNQTLIFVCMQWIQLNYLAGSRGVKTKKHFSLLFLHLCFLISSGQWDIIQRTQLYLAFNTHSHSSSVPFFYLFKVMIQSNKITLGDCVVTVTRHGILQQFASCHAKSGQKDDQCEPALKFHFVLVSLHSKRRGNMIRLPKKRLRKANLSINISLLTK